MSEHLPNAQRKHAEKQKVPLPFSIFIKISFDFQIDADTSQTPSVKPFQNQNLRLRIPSSKRQFQHSSSPPVLSPLPSIMNAKLNALLESPTFKKRKHSSTATALEKARKKAELKPRLKDSRALMNGYESTRSKDYYDALGLHGDERKKHINRTSRRRGFQEMPPTPPRYWDIEAPSPEEIKELGYVIDTDSPLLKKKSSKKRF